MARILPNYDDGTPLNSPYGGFEPTLGKRPETPFPGVAPVPTMRRQIDGTYDQGVDMGDGRGRAKNYTCLDIGAGGKLGVDPGQHATEGEVEIPMDAAFWGVPVPVRRRRRG